MPDEFPSYWVELLPKIRTYLADRLLTSTFGMNEEQLMKCFALVPAPTGKKGVSLRLINQSHPYFTVQRDFMGNDPKMKEDPMGEKTDFYPIDPITGISLGNHEAEPRKSYEGGEVQHHVQEGWHIADRGRIKEIEEEAITLFSELAKRNPRKIRCNWSQGNESKSVELAANSWDDLAKIFNQLLPPDEQIDLSRKTSR